MKPKTTTTPKDRIKKIVRKRTKDSNIIILDKNTANNNNNDNEEDDEDLKQQQNSANKANKNTNNQKYQDVMNNLGKTLPNYTVNDISGTNNNNNASVNGPHSLYLKFEIRRRSNNDSDDDEVGGCDEGKDKNSNFKVIELLNNKNKEKLSKTFSPSQNHYRPVNTNPASLSHI